MIINGIIYLNVISTFSAVCLKSVVTLGTYEEGGTWYTDFWYPGFPEQIQLEVYSWNQNRNQKMSKACLCNVKHDYCA